MTLTVHPISDEDTHNDRMAKPAIPETLIDFTHPALTNPDWRQQAACRNDTTGANWFPEQHQAGNPATRRAYQICAECPVRLECLRYAMLTDDHRDRGIYGGMSPRNRSRLRGELIAAGRLPSTRVCANPACRAEFPARPTTPRHNVCCSDECRLARRRLLAASAARNRAMPPQGHVELSVMLGAARRPVRP